MASVRASPSLILRLTASALNSRKTSSSIPLMKMSRLAMFSSLSWLWLIGFRDIGVESMAKGKVETVKIEIPKAVYEFYVRLLRSARRL